MSAEAKSPENRKQNGEYKSDNASNVARNLPRPKTSQGGAATLWNPVAEPTKRAVAAYLAQSGYC
jgi:hypothetical protein